MNHVIIECMVECSVQYLLFDKYLLIANSSLCLLNGGVCFPGLHGHLGVERVGVDMLPPDDERDQVRGRNAGWINDGHCYAVALHAGTGIALSH